MNMPWPKEENLVLYVFTTLLIQWQYSDDVDATTMEEYFAGPNLKRKIKGSCETKLVASVLSSLKIRNWQTPLTCLTNIICEQSLSKASLTSSNWQFKEKQNKRQRSIFSLSINWYKRQKRDKDLKYAYSYLILSCRNIL